ncbi:hypothetical protein TNCV_2374921 [Trichonephila clavipes]|nr:hypothetical protein TNCV_2374921 [Trichonephila clavipes]
MVSPQGQAQIVAWFIEFKSAKHMQSEFRITNKRDQPLRFTICKDNERFIAIGSVLIGVSDKYAAYSCTYVLHHRSFSPNEKTSSVQKMSPKPIIILTTAFECV